MQKGKNYVSRAKLDQHGDVPAVHHFVHDAALQFLRREVEHGDTDRQQANRNLVAFAQPPYISQQKGRGVV